MISVDLEIRKFKRLDAAALQRELARLWVLPPSSVRDALIGMAELRLATMSSPKKAHRYYLSGYSYARTSRHPAVRRLAEEVRAIFDE